MLPMESSRVVLTGFFMRNAEITFYLKNETGLVYISSRTSSPPQFLTPFIRISVFFKILSWVLGAPWHLLWRWYLQGESLAANKDVA